MPKIYIFILPRLKGVNMSEKGKNALKVIGCAFLMAASTICAALAESKLSETLNESQRRKQRQN